MYYGDTVLQSGTIHLDLNHLHDLLSLFELCPVSLLFMYKICNFYTPTFV